MKNIEMFQRIHTQITADPRSHYQGDWEMPTKAECGTTRCVAGWALHFWGEDNGLTIGANGKPVGIYALRNEYINRNVSEYERDLWDFSEVGADILGLDSREADDLFLNFSNSDTARMVREYAAGCDRVLSGESVHCTDMCCRPLGQNED